MMLEEIARSLKCPAMRDRSGGQFLAVLPLSLGSLQKILHSSKVRKEHAFHGTRFQWILKGVSIKPQGIEDLLPRIFVVDFSFLITKTHTPQRSLKKSIHFAFEWLNIELGVIFVVKSLVPHNEGFCSDASVVGCG